MVDEKHFYFQTLLFWVSVIFLYLLANRAILSLSNEDKKSIYVSNIQLQSLKFVTCILCVPGLHSVWIINIFRLLAQY